MLAHPRQVAFVDGARMPYRNPDSTLQVVRSADSPDIKEARKERVWTVILWPVCANRPSRFTHCQQAIRTKAK